MGLQMALAYIPTDMYNMEAKCHALSARGSVRMMYGFQASFESH